MGRFGKTIEGLVTGIRDLRLPVRVPLPSREELAAAGLSTLAVGLAIGLAIGPGINSGIFMPAIAAPLAEATDDALDDEVPLPTLGAPAGRSGGVTTASAVPGGTPDTSPVVAPPTSSPAPAPTSLETPSEPTGGGAGGDPPDNPDSLPVTATVVSVSVTGKSYAVADEFGNLFSIFTGKAPALGEEVKTRISPLINGTFLEAAGRKVLGEKPEAAIRGVVSYVESQVGVMVISSRGVSIALDGKDVLADAGPNLRIAATATAKISLGSAESQEVIPTTEAPDPTLPVSVPEPRILELELNFYEGTAVELTGRLEVLDRSTRKAKFAADSSGILASSVEALLPPEVPIDRLKVGYPYSVTLREGVDGLLSVTGFSPAWSGKSANDPEASYGEQGA